MIVGVKALGNLCGPGTYCVVQIGSGITAIVAALAPDSVLGNADFLWLWRGIISASIALNLFFLRGIWKKVQRIGPHNRAIATLQVAVKFLAREAAANGEKRFSDAMIMQMMEDVDLLTKTQGDDL